MASLKRNHHDIVDIDNHDINHVNEKQFKLLDEQDHRESTPPSSVAKVGTSSHSHALICPGTSGMSGSPSSTCSTASRDLIRFMSIADAIKPNASHWKAGPNAARKSATGPGGDDDFRNANVLDILPITVYGIQVEELRTTKQLWFGDYFLDAQNDQLSSFKNYLSSIISFDIQEAKLTAHQVKLLKARLQEEGSVPLNVQKDIISLRSQLPHGAYYSQAVNSDAEATFDINFSTLKENYDYVKDTLNNLSEPSPRDKMILKLDDNYGQRYLWYERLVALKSFLRRVYSYLTLQNSLQEEQFVELFASFAAVAGFDFVNGENLRKSGAHILGVWVTGIPDLRCYKDYDPETLGNCSGRTVLAVAEVKSKITQEKKVNEDLLGQGIAQMLLDIQHTAMKKNGTCNGMVCYFVECTQVRIGFLGIPNTLQKYIFRKEVPQGGIIRYEDAELGQNGHLYLSNPLDIMKKVDRDRLWKFMLQMKT